jgi:Protein of unknown function (DUF3352)
VRAPSDERKRGGEQSAKYRRRRIGAALAVAAVAVVVLMVALSGSGEAAPDSAAASVVPADALAFISVSTDPTRPAVEQVLALAKEFPGYAAARPALLARLSAVVSGSRRAGFSNRLPSWTGGEAAVAVLDTNTATAGSLIALEVSDRTRAAMSLDRSGATARGSYKGTPLLGYESGTELAFVRQFLVLGQDASVRAAIDAAAGASRWPRAPAIAAPPRGSPQTGCSTPKRRSPACAASSRLGPVRSARSAGCWISPRSRA